MAACRGAVLYKSLLLLLGGAIMLLAMLVHGKSVHSELSFKKQRFAIQMVMVILRAVCI